jgi:hypothetical protein
MLLNQDYRASDTTLLEEFAAWLTARGETDPEAIVGDAGVFTFWRRIHSTGVLDAFDEDDIVEFLLEWCPRKHATDADLVCAAVGTFLEFLGDIGGLAGGRNRAEALSTLANRLTPTVRVAMANPDDRGMAQMVFRHPMVNPPGQPRYAELLAQGWSEKKLNAELERRITAYQALPPDVREALLAGRFFDEEPEPVEVPFVHIPPPAEEVEAVAGAAPLLQKIEGLREYLGDSGKPLTQKGNIKLADGKALIELLDTGDHAEWEFDDHTYRKNSTERLSGLNSIVNLAKDAGAVRVHQRRLVPTKNWSRNSATDRAAAVYDAIIERGAIGSRDNPYELMQAIGDALDPGTVHWLAAILAPEAEVDFDEIVDLAEPVLRDEIEPYWPQWSDRIESFARNGISDIFATLEAAGVVEWTDRGETRLGSNTYPSGGTIRLTALGRDVVPHHLPEAGYALRSLDDLADAPASELIDALDWVPDEQRQPLMDAWQPGLEVGDRVGLIVEMIGSAEDPALRFKGFTALEPFDSDVVGPAVRRLLDGPAAGNAALYLLSRGLADEAEVGGFIDIGVFVDVLAAGLDDPEELCEMFSEGPQSADQYAALEQMVRHPAAETQLVLDALGEHLHDKKLAKAARKAAMRHRSWMANRC